MLTQTFLRAARRAPMKTHGLLSNFSKREFHQGFKSVDKYINTNVFGMSTKLNPSLFPIQKGFQSTLSNIKFGNVTVTFKNNEAISKVTKTIAENGKEVFKHYKKAIDSGMNKALVVPFSFLASLFAYAYYADILYPSYQHKIHIFKKNSVLDKISRLIVGGGAGLAFMGTTGLATCLTLYFTLIPMLILIIPGSGLYLTYIVTTNEPSPKRKHYY